MQVQTEDRRDGIIQALVALVREEGPDRVTIKKGG